MSSVNDHTVAKLSDELKSWNPLRDAYYTSNLNEYNGANVGGLVSGRQKHHQSRDMAKIKPYLVINQAKNLTKEALHTICSDYGLVTEVISCYKADLFFVYFSTVADMEAVFRGLSNNDFGFNVKIGNRCYSEPKFKTKQNNYEGKGKLEPSSEIINMDRRSYMLSAKKHERPLLPMEPLVDDVDYQANNSLLSRNDPQRHFLIKYDAHGLERDGVPPMDMPDTDSRHYRTGRGFISLSNEANKVIAAAKSAIPKEYDAIEHGIKWGALNAQDSADCGNCIVCARVCNCRCSCCSVFFCSTHCNEIAWREHQHKGYNQEKTPVAVGTDSAPAAMPPNGTPVMITCVVDTNFVFIRSILPADDNRFFSTITQIQAASRTLKQLDAPPKCGQVVIVQFHEQYNRALVLNANNKECVRLVYMDYGNVENRRMSELYAAPEQLVALPRFAMPVLLKNVRDAYMTDNVRKFMYSYLHDKELLVRYDPEQDLVNNRGIYCVELVDKTTGHNFNKRLVMLTKFVEPNDNDLVCFSNHLKQLWLPDGDLMELIVMDNSLLNTGCLSCTTPTFAAEIKKFERELELYGNSIKEETPYAPRVGELCIAKYDVDGKWYRGRCLDLVGDGHPTILFFDYGNLVTVNIKDILRYPAQFTFPIFTVDCEIVGLPECCEPKLVARLEELIPNGSTIRCDHLKLFEEDGFHQMTIARIVQQLRDEGLLRDVDVKCDKIKRTGTSVSNESI